MPVITQTCDGKTRTYFISTTPLDDIISVNNTGSCPFEIIVVRAGAENIRLRISQRENKEINATSITKVQIKCLKCDCGTCCEGFFSVGGGF